MVFKVFRSIGELIEIIERLDKPLDVMVNGFFLAKDSELCSYRGYYYHLCLVPKLESTDYDNNLMNTDDLLKMLKASIGETYTGYKGGEFDMDSDTLLYTAEDSDRTGLQLFKVNIAEHYFRLIGLSEEDIEEDIPIEAKDTCEKGNKIMEDKIEAILR